MKDPETPWQEIVTLGDLQHAAQKLTDKFKALEDEARRLNASPGIVPRLFEIPAEKQQVVFAHHIVSLLMDALEME